MISKYGPRVLVVVWNRDSHDFIGSVHENLADTVDRASLIRDH